MLLASLISKDSSACKVNANTIPCVEYIDNYDGDTVKVNLPNFHYIFGKDLSVRIANIDTAEIKTKNPCEKTAAIKAKKLVHQILNNAKKISLINVKRGKYFRVVADISADGVSIAKTLKKHKLAVSYSGGTKKQIDWCALTVSQNIKYQNYIGGLNK